MQACLFPMYLQDALPNPSSVHISVNSAYTGAFHSARLRDNLLQIVMWLSTGTARSASFKLDDSVGDDRV